MKTHAEFLEELKKDLEERFSCSEDQYECYIYVLDKIQQFEAELKQVKHDQ